MFNIAVDANGKTYNATELVENKSEADIGNARKRKYFCMTCVGEKHPVSLNVRRKQTQVNKKSRQYTAKAWFSHHGGGHGEGENSEGGKSGNSKTYPGESCSETAIHCHAKHILCQDVERYWYETSKCIGCQRHTKIENGVGAFGRVEYTEKIPGGTMYIFDAVLMRGDETNRVVHSVLEVWATHETSDDKREYCLRMGYTFAEFHASHVVEMHEKTQPGGIYKLENLKIREFECQQCEHARKQNEIRLEEMRLQKEAAEEQAKLLKAAADEKARLAELLVQEKQREREKVDFHFYETCTGAETRVIELQNDLHATYMYKMWTCGNFAYNSVIQPHELDAALTVWQCDATNTISCKELGIHIASRLATIQDPLAWYDWQISAAKQVALQRMLEIKAGALKLNYTKYEKGVSFKCICAKWAREDHSIPSCKRIYRDEMEYSDFYDIVKKHKVWEFDRDKRVGFDEHEEQMSFIKTCGLCSTSCVFCGTGLLLNTAVKEGQCSMCNNELGSRIVKMAQQSHMHTRYILARLYADIDTLYKSDAYRGFFDYAIEYRVRTEACTEARNKRLLEFSAKTQRQHHSNKTTTSPPVTNSKRETLNYFLSGPLGLPYPGFKN